MVALCAQCQAPLTLADLGFDICLNCHWQHLFEYSPTNPAELRLELRGAPGASSDEAWDLAGRYWRGFPGDGETWCVLCGAIIEEGWTQGGAGGPQAHLCAEHVDLL